MDGGEKNGILEEDNNCTALSFETVNALAQFYEDRRHQILTPLVPFVEQSETILSIDEFEENWQLSQFWYDNETRLYLASKVIEQITSLSSGSHKMNYMRDVNFNIALIACPSLYFSLKQQCRKYSLVNSVKVKLFEFDRRFHVYGEDFIHYNFLNPVGVPKNWKNYFDMVIMDPPFLSEDCVLKCAITAKFLTKEKIIVCTGSVMEPFLKRILKVDRCSFIPKHKNNLANNFACFINFNTNVF